MDQPIKTDFLRKEVCFFLIINNQTHNKGLWLKSKTPSYNKMEFYK